MKRWEFFTSVFISIFSIWLTFHNIRLSTLSQVLDSAQYIWLLPGVFIYFWGLWIRANRWKYHLNRKEKIPFHTFLSAAIVGHAVNLIAFGRKGEVVRSLILKRKSNVSVSTSISTTFVENFADKIILLIFVFAGSQEFFRALWGTGNQYSLLALSAFLVICFGLLKTHLKAGFGSIKDYWVVQPFAKVSVTPLLSVAVQLCDIFLYWFVMKSVQVEVNLLVVIFLVGVINLIFLSIPLLWQFGVFELIGVAVLSVYGVNIAVAFGFTIILHLALWAATGLPAIYILLREHGFNNIVSAFDQNTLSKILAGDSTTDAPPPDFSKKKKKGN